jgi:hypothetical protein
MCAFVVANASPLIEMCDLMRASSRGQGDLEMTPLGRPASSAWRSLHISASFGACDIAFVFYLIRTSPLTRCPPSQLAEPRELPPQVRLRHMHAMAPRLHRLPRYHHRDRRDALPLRLHRRPRPCSATHHGARPRVYLFFVGPYESTDSYGRYLLEVSDGGELAATASSCT